MYLARLAFLGLSALLGFSTTVSRADQPATPEAVQMLEKLAGTWSAERVEFFDADGELRQTSSAYAHNEFTLDGNFLVHRGRLNEPPIESRSWYFISPKNGRLRMNSISSSGRYDEFTGGWQDKRLVMTSVPESSTGDRLFRMTHAEITENSYIESLEVSADGGQTWRTTSRQTMHLVRPETVLDALQTYTGRWRSDDKTGGDGTAFHFTYDMNWLDAGNSIARMVISRVDSEQNTSIIFEGYKGLQPGGKVYYHGASPSGRGAHGIVILQGENLVTAYDGWTAEADVVRVRDVFGPVEDDSFTSRTFLRQPEDLEWRQVGEDVWTRIGTGN